MEENKCEHEFNWEQAWIPAKILLKTKETVPLTKYWSSNCKKCGEIIPEYAIPFKENI